MTYDTDQFIKDLRDSEGRRFVEERASLVSIKLVRQQTMHSVFYVAGDPGVYIKLAKVGKEDQPDKREMDVEALWYNILRESLHLPGAPKATTFTLGQQYVLAVEEVQGETYDQIFRRSLKPTDITKVLTRSAEITAKGYLLHEEMPQATPAFFGDFNEGEFNFLVGRTLKILRANNVQGIDSLESLLKITKGQLTDHSHRLFYRDATPLNWVEDKEGNVVAIDLGSTSYRPPQFELIAFLETPQSGLDAMSETQRESIIRLYATFLCFYAERGQILKDFRLNYALASVVKNASAVASRIDHTNTNRKSIEGSDPNARKIAEERLPANIQGRNFHAERLRIALVNSTDFFAKAGYRRELTRVIDTFFNQFG